MSVEHVTHGCATEGCFAIITMHPAEDARLKRTHETFYCPAGHHNYFAGKTEHEKRIASLERQVLEAQSHWAEQYRIVDQLIGVLRTCPFHCGWRSGRRTHGNPGRWDYARLSDRMRADLREHLRACHCAEAEVAEPEVVSA